MCDFVFEALLVAKVTAAAMSGSLVVISSMLDSAMDLVSGALVWWSNRAIKKTNYYFYPRGIAHVEIL
jgi:divalent metal cation (Fe/Co/Zn/Cd) transporter